MHGEQPMGKEGQCQSLQFCVVCGVMHASGMAHGLRSDVVQRIMGYKCMRIHITRTFCS